MTQLSREPGGSVAVSDSALAAIVVSAAQSVDGARVRRSRRHRPAIEIAGPHARVELELGVGRGHVLPEVAGDVQERVAAALGAMCGVEVTVVDVSIEELDR